MPGGLGGNLGGCGGRGRTGEAKESAVGIGIGSNVPGRGGGVASASSPEGERRYESFSEVSVIGESSG